jgi:hypothetical protein
MGLRETIAGAFSFLGTRSQSEERMAQYVIREHERGRSLEEILDDPYVKNRCTEREVARVLERPEVIHALGDDIAAAARTEQA